MTHSPQQQDWDLLPAEAESLLHSLSSSFFLGEPPPLADTSSAAPTGQEVSSAQMLEARLHRAETRYRMLIEQIPAVTFLAGLNDDGNEIYVSPQIETLLGFTQREWLENPVLWYSQLHPEDRQRWHIEFARTCATGAPFCAEYRFIAKDGRVVWVRGEAKLVHDDQGHLLYLQGVAFDITAIKRAEVELRAMNENLARRVSERTAALEHTTNQLSLSNTLLRDGETRLRTILDTAAEGIITINSDGLIEGFNRAAEHIFGYEAKEVQGHNVALLMPASYAQEHDQYIAAYLQTGIKKIIGIGREVTGLRKDGSVFPLELSVSEVPLEGRRLFTGVVRDITERKRHEIALQQAKDEAEAANHAKSNFLSRTSHELRTPLNAILGFGQLLEMSQLTPRQQRQVGQIVKGGRHLLNLINEVLDIARIEAGNMELALEPIRVGIIVQEVLDLAQPLVVQGNIEMNVELAGFENRYLRADNQRLKQILLNLLSNSVKYNRAQGKVTVRCEQPIEGRLRLSVQDTGHGIPPHKFKRLFTPFDRLGAEASSIEGSGLGLVLSQQLAEAMSGTLGCRSVPGEGSTFFVELAEVSDPAQPQAGLPTPESVSEAGASVIRTVLYVEDNLANLDLIEEVLAYRPQVRLLSALQGESGLSLAAVHRPDLILLDVQLPDMHGEEFLQKMQQDPTLRDIPVIVLSADATANQIHRLRAAGAQDYLTKPIDVMQFLKAMDKVLHRNRD